MGVFLGLVALSSPSYTYTAMALVGLGFSAGLFAVPLNAFLQQKAGREEKGQLIATNNFINTIGIVLAAAIHWLLKTPLQLTPDTIIMLTGLLTLGGTIAILYFLPDYFVRLILWLFTHTVYRMKIVGAEHMPLKGPALLVSNHVSLRRCVYGRRRLAAARTLHAAPRVLRPQTLELVFSPHAFDSGVADQPARYRAIAQARAQRIGQRPCCLHFC